MTNIMEQLKISQLSKKSSLSKEEAHEILKERDVNYCIPDTHSTYPGYTFLHFAAKATAFNLTTALLEKGANLVKQGTDDGCTPLHKAINTAFERKSRYYYSEVTRYSEKLKKSKNKEVRELSLMKILLSKQVEFNNTSNPTNEHGLSHLHIASIINHSEAVELFAKAKEPIDQSIDCDFDDNDYSNFMKNNHLQGFTPLHCAIKYSAVEAADILLQYDADLYVKNADGLNSMNLLVVRLMDIADFIRMGKRTVCMPYLEEMMERTESIIKLVLKMKAVDKIFVDDTGLSALHLACTLRDKSVVQNLLKQNVDVNIRVNNESELWPGWTPLHFAACFSIETFILLLQSGSDIKLENSKGETALDLCAKRFTSTDIQLILSTRNELKNIVLSDNKTKLLDLLLIMNDFDKFQEFMQQLKDVNLTVSFDSPIWAGYNLLHLCVSLNEKKILWQDFLKKFNPFEIAEDASLTEYNCTEEDETLYGKRIRLCLQYGCNVNMKNVKGQTPIHLAFSSRREAAVVEKLLSCSEENVIDHNGLSHLHIACALGRLDKVKIYVAKRANVNSQVKINFDWHQRNNVEKKILINMGENSTPLHVAVRCDHRNVVEYLLQNDADVYAKDSFDLTPIHALMFRSYVCSKLAKVIFNSISKLRDSVSEDGLSLLHVAASAENVEAVKRLLLEGAEIERVVETNVKKLPFLASLVGKTPLHVAVEACSEEAVKVLLEEGANIHAKDLEGTTPLQYVINHLNEMSTKVFIPMLKNGKYDVEPSGLTLLHIASTRHDIKWIKKLIQEGTDVNAIISADGDLEGATPLYMVFEPSAVLDVVNNIAAATKIIKLLLKSGADVNLKCDGLTILHMLYDRIYITANEFSLDHFDETFIYDELLPIIDLLLESQKSYDVNPIDNQGFSHFHFACVRNNVETVTKFLDHGVDVNLSVDPFADCIGGFTPLHFAMAHGSREVAYILLDRGADVKAEDANGNQPLHAAVKGQFLDMPLFESILKRGADIKAENLREETLLHCFLRSNNVTLEMLEYFLVRGCVINDLNTIDKNCQGIIGLAMFHTTPTVWPKILKRLTQVFDVRKASQNGFNMIQSVVAVKQYGHLSEENYLNTIEFLMNIGYELDQQDAEGKTALHKAVSFYNLEAVYALLQLGADVNVVDNLNECPLSDRVIASIDTRRKSVVRLLARHIWKLKLIGLDVNNANLRILEKLNTEMLPTELLEESCQVELTKAYEIKIGQDDLTVNDFLSETGAVMRYSRMGPDKQASVDQFFICTLYLRQTFPELFGVLNLQYRKASARMKLLEPATEVIASICPVKLPEFWENILEFFNNNEMKDVIALGKQLFNYS